MWIKACPRCSGDLFVEHLPGGEEVTCLQCGYNPPEQVIAQIRLTAKQGRRGRAAGPGRAVAAARVA